MNPEKKVDAAVFPAAFRANLAKHDAANEAPAASMPRDLKQKIVALMEQEGPGVEAEAQSLMGIDLGDFCVRWPKIKASIDRALWFAKFFLPPSAIAGIKAFVATFEEIVLPLVCDTPAP